MASMIIQFSVAEKGVHDFDKAFRANKAIQDYVFTDGIAEGKH